MMTAMDFDLLGDDTESGNATFRHSASAAASAAAATSPTEDLLMLDGSDDAFNMSHPPVTQYQQSSPRVEQDASKSVDGTLLDTDSGSIVDHSFTIESAMADADEFGDFTQSEVVNVWADLTPDSEATDRTNKEPAADEGSGKKDDDDEDDFGDFVDASKDSAAKTEDTSPELAPVSAQNLPTKTKPGDMAEVPILQPETAGGAMAGFIPPPPAPTNPSKHRDSSPPNTAVTGLSGHGQRSRALPRRLTNAISGSADPLDIASGQILDWLEAPNTTALGHDGTYGLDNVGEITRRLDTLATDSTDGASMNTAATTYTKSVLDPAISCSIDVQPVPPASLGHKPDHSLAPRLWDIIWPQPDSHANLIQELDTDRGDLVQAYLRLADLSRNQ